MTVCIAGTFQLEPYHRGFVLCTDGRLDAGAWGHSDTGVKVHGLGHNFYALMAGDWSTAMELCSSMEADNRLKFTPKDAGEIFGRFESSITSFCSSVLCQGDVEILVSGFIGKNPLLIRASIEGKQPSLKVVHGIDAVGEGAHASLMMLTYRGYDPLNVQRDHASYLIYEAKKFSENVSSVGPKTLIKIHLPLSRSGFQFGVDRLAADEYNWRDLRPEAIGYLEGIRKKSFLQPIEEFYFPDTSFC